eukprot:m.24680 g.24680  ORF g.24680 m.24680 type:complete len:89 (-) comp13095_c0_seq1:112-378(-)
MASGAASEKMTTTTSELLSAVAQQLSHFENDSNPVAGGCRFDEEHDTTCNLEALSQGQLLKQHKNSRGREPFDQTPQNTLLRKPQKAT